MFFVILESFTSAFASIRAHGMRSFLTMLGIIIGVASIIAMVSVMEGMKSGISQQLENLGASSIRVYAFTTEENRLQGVFAKLTDRDLSLIAERVDGISMITPVVQASLQVRSGSKVVGARSFGTTWNFQVMDSQYTQLGRYISYSDNQTRRKVAVIGETIRDELNLPDDPVGEYININEEWIKVVGLLESKGEIMGNDLDNLVILPYSTMLTLQGNRYDPNIVIIINAVDNQAMDNVVGQITRLLRRAHNLEGDEENDFKVETAEQLGETISNITSIVTAVMGGVLSISLLVGGIGIMNIMLVSVTERTREIGICKAIGAKRHHILLQFLFEAVALCLMGGMVGLVIGYGFGYGASAAVDILPEAQVPLWSVVLAFGFSASVGLIFGILPAAKAANLDPIDALRYE